MVIKKDDPGLLAALIPVLKKDDPVILPCDTIYGIVGSAPGAEEKIRVLKGRGEHKPFLQLIAEAAWLKEYSGQIVPKRLLGYWPGPLTLVVRRKDGPGKVALRVPQDELLRQLLLALGKSVFSTSVNRSGQQFLRRIDEIVGAFLNKVAVIVDGGDLPNALPSTIVDVSDSPFRLVRQGSLVLPADVLR